MSASTPLPTGHRSRVAFARLLQRLGAAGLVGCALIAAASLWLWSSWRTHADDSSMVAVRATQQVLPAPVPSARQMPASALPHVDEVPRLLLRIERAAKESGLGWPRADYRFNDASTDLPASVDVRFALTGTYPAIRRFVTTLLQDTPTLTIREFALSRGGAEIAEVDAKLAIVIYVADSARGSRP